MLSAQDKAIYHRLPAAHSRPWNGHMLCVMSQSGEYHRLGDEEPTTKCPRASVPKFKSVVEALLQVNHEAIDDRRLAKRNFKIFHRLCTPEHARPSKKMAIVVSIEREKH